MLHFIDPLRDINFLSMFFRLLIAFVCGGAIGLERTYKNRPAGLRTHILVCIGGTIASATGIYLYVNAGFPTDITRLAAQVVSGLGFIGAGTIIITKNQTIKGLTTAAGLWTSGIIGLAVGAGFYEGAIITTVLIIITETYFSVLVQRIVKTPEFMIILHYHHKPALDQALRYCKDKRLLITNLQVKGECEGENPIYAAVITVKPRQNQKVDHDAIISHIKSISGVFGVEEEDF